ncbi:hypothetical protein [Microcoleus sp. B7-D4]|uniref:hypothetical protein n=1 Tax=Microcoleus sp. B7-D4 TaxID=2818696 RepID=UPI002FD11122
MQKLVTYILSMTRRTAISICNIRILLSLQYSGASHLCGQARNWSFEAGGRRQEAEGKRKKEGATRRKEPEEVFLQI